MAVDIHFAVLVCLFPRPQDPFFHLPEMTSLLSIARQDYPHWRILLLGDGLGAADVARVHDMLRRSEVPPDKVDFRIVPISHGERWGVHLDSWDVGEPPLAA